MKVPLTKVSKVGFSLVRFLKVSLLIFFFAFLLINIVLTAIQEKDVNVVFRELGEEFFNPLISAQEISLDIVQEEKVGLLDSLWNYWGFYYQLFIIIIWIYLFKKLFDFLFHGTTPPIVRIGMAVILFLFIEVVYVTWILKGSPGLVFEAIRDIFNGIIHIFTGFNFKEGKESLIQVNNTCLDDVCVI